MFQSRRNFLGLAAAATASAGFPWSRPAFANRAANDRPRVGCIGVGGMGKHDARNHREFGDIIVVCDVDSQHAERGASDEEIGNGKADACGDYRQVLERNDIDLVSIVVQLFDEVLLY